MITAQEIRRGLRPIREKLLRNPGVLFVGIGEIVESSQYCVVAGIDDQGAHHADNLPDRITIHGQSICLTTELVSSEAFKVADGNLDGSDLLIASSVGRVGTLGLVMRDARTNKLFGITNAHVVTRPDQNHVGDQVKAILDGVTQDIGHVAFHSAYRSTGVNTVDLALIELNANGVSHARAFEVQTFPGTVVGSGGLSFSRFAGSQRPHAYGGSTQSARYVVICERPVEHPQIQLRDRTGDALQFGRAFTLSTRGTGVLPGHSGALVVRKMSDGDLIAVGLLAGGRGPTAVAFSMSDVIREVSRAGFDIA